MGNLDEKVGDLFESSTIIFIGLIVGNGLALFAETLIARSLQPSIYGSLALAYTIALLSSRIADFGIKDGVVRMVSTANDLGERTHIFQHGLMIVFSTALIIGIFLTSARGLIGGLVDDPKVSSYLIFFVPLVMLLALRAVAFGMLRAEGRSLAAAIARDFLGRILPLSVLGLGILLGVPAMGAIGYWLSVSIIVLGVSFVVLHSRYPLVKLLDVDVSRDTVFRLTRFSLPLAMSAYILILLSHLDILMIGYFLESNQVGYYRAIQPLRRASTLLMTSFTFLFLPVATQFYENDNISGLERFYTVSTKWLAAGTLPMVLVFVLFADDVVRTLFGAAYSPAAPALAVLVSGFYFRAIVGLDSEIVKAIDYTKIEFWSAMVGVIANIILNIYLIPRIGIVGAAIGTGAGYIIYNIVEVVAIYRRIGIHPFGMNNFKPLIVTTIIALAIHQTTTHIKFGIIGLAVLGTLFGIITLISIVATRSLDETDLLFIERIEDRTGLDLSLLKKKLSS
ncbi:flippase [Halobellus clavatus]|uniref:Membrane protein involved in the export of O-antigen and teichoic acid n=1 Tax=Halobellus clavatus TaxID=660517 RepID=A0A1H3JX52_9EURY|nr:flippase [Halobellus clavatus]SDY44503.1 Membrane protein involved in the export of O-antigen and teichoic acid [Halobellus clavatus]